MKCDNKNLLLYAVTDRSWHKDRTLAEQVETVLKGGVTFVQLREKELSPDDFRKEALEIQSLCKRYQVPFVINDSVSLAREIGADGVHVGQSDMEAGSVREQLGEDKIIGVSVQTVEQAILAQKQGADYVGVGAVFPTDSKKDASAVSKEILTAICEAVEIPVIAIGGITSNNVSELKNTGICGVAVISALFAQDDIRLAAQMLKQKTLEVISRRKSEHDEYSINNSRK